MQANRPAAFSAVVAASQDPNAVGVIGLDPTDANDLGLGYASSVSVPALGLVGVPSNCNSNNNGIACTLPAPNSYVRRVTDADHCDLRPHQLGV